MHHYVMSMTAELLALEGVTRDRWFAEADFDPEDLPPNRLLSAQQINQLSASAINLSGDAYLGIHLGQRLQLVSLGMFGYALLTSARVGEVLNLILRYNRAISPNIDITLVSTGDSIELRNKTAPLPTNLQRFHADALYASVYANLKILAPESLNAVSVELNYPAPDTGTLYQEVFGDRVRFDADRCGMIFNRECLAIEIASSDPMAQDIFRRQCDRMLSNDVHAGSVSEQVTRELLADRSSFPSSATIAKRLHTSESTLQRRLAREGTKFQPLLDRVRYRLALEYLEGTDLQVFEIATLLDFSSAANFRRAFKRWSGKTPSQWRDAAGLQSTES